MKKLEKDTLDLKEGLKKEWLITNRNWRVCFINCNWV